MPRLLSLIFILFLKLVRYIIPGLLFLALSILNGQDLKISGIVADAMSEDELPFANIMVLNRTIGTSSDSKGFFELILADSLINDSIIISYVGYQKLTFCISDIEGGIIKLIPHRIKLNEVVIKPSHKKAKTIIVNKFKRRKCSIRYAPLNNGSTEVWIPFRPEEPTIEALYFPYKEEYGESRRLQEVRLKVSNLKAPPTYFSLHIFHASDDKSPGDDLLTKPIIVEVTETTSAIIINLEEYNLIIPENGLFVGFELLIIDENKRIFQFENGNSLTTYSPYLNFLRVKEEQHFWLYTMGKWKKTIWTRPHYLKKDEVVYYKPAISIVLSD